MPFASTAILDLLKLLLNNTAWGGVGDTNGLQPSAAAGSWFLSLHTATPGAGGDQTTNEIAYTGYARVAVARTSGGLQRDLPALDPRERALPRARRRESVPAIDVRPWHMLPCRKGATNP